MHLCPFVLLIPIALYVYLCDLDRVSKGLHLPVAAGATIVLVWLVARGRGLGRPEGIALLGLYAAYVGGSIAAAVV